MNLPTLLLQLYVYLASSCTPRDAFPTRNHGDRGLWGQGAGHASQMVCKHSGSTLDTSDSTHNAGEFSLIRTPEISVVIRSREEERHLKTLINQIRHQTIKNTEIILVVDYSDSQTLLNLRRLRADKVLSLSHNQFNHAYSTNLGVAASRGELVAITNGHSLPFSDSWLEAAARHFENPRVAGVTGLSTPFPDGSVWEKLYFTPVNIKLYRKRWLLRLLYKIGPRMFSTTNCMIRRSLWTEYPFDETLLQCEDYDWGVEMRARGYLTPIDPEFSVYHSHGDALGVFLSRLRKWEILKGRIITRTRPRVSHTRLVTSVPIDPQDLMSAAS